MITLFQNSILSLKQGQISLCYVNYIFYSLIWECHKMEMTIDSDLRFWENFKILYQIPNRSIYIYIIYTMCKLHNSATVTLQVPLREHTRILGQSWWASALWKSTPGDSDTRPITSYPYCHYQLIMFHHPLLMYFVLFFYTKC